VGTCLHARISATIPHVIGYDHMAG
jgi:hypothetical protein